MLKVFEYTNYREYLAAWLNEKKKSQPAFSYGLFARVAGFTDRGFLHNVIHGKRDLTKESLVKVSQAIGHSKAEAEYFENLVFFNKSPDLKTRGYFFEKLNNVKSNEKAAVKALQTRKDQYDFYSQWYYSAIRSLIDMYPFAGDYNWLAKSVYPPISAREARKAVQLLEKLELIKKGKDNTYQLTDKSITTGNEIASLAVNNFHKSICDLAKNALESVPADKRNVTSLTLGISEKTYQKICADIQTLRSKIVQMVREDETADRTYQLNFHLFPITKVAPAIKGDI